MTKLDPKKAVQLTIHYYKGDKKATLQSFKDALIQAQNSSNPDAEDGVRIIQECIDETERIIAEER